MGSRLGRSASLSAARRICGENRRPGHGRRSGRPRRDRERPDFDLLLTDVVRLGGMNGRQIATRALQLRPGLKVLFITGYTQNAIVHDGRLDEGVSLISKPFTYDPPGAKVRAELDGLHVPRQS